jgi:hypothetical protein
MENHEDNKRGFAPPFPDRLTAADRERLVAEYEAGAAVRRAMLVRRAPWWMRALAKLPDPHKPLEDWIASAKTRARKRP